MIPMFHCVLFCSSPLITTTSPTLTSDSFLLCFKLYLYLNDVRYSLLHLFQAASLHFWMYFWRFCRSLSSIFSGSSFGIISCWPNTSKFGVKSGNSMFSSMQFKGLLRFSQYLLKPLLIHATPTLICQLFYAMHFSQDQPSFQTAYPIKVLYSNWISTWYLCVQKVM